jgi:putative transposase
MPRKARIDAPGALHHIIVRGINRRKIFFDDSDRDDFFDRLGGILSDSETACFAWGDNGAQLLPEKWIISVN